MSDNSVAQPVLVMKRASPKKLQNRALLIEEHEAHTAKGVAKCLLHSWYTNGIDRANAILPRMQVDSNLKLVAAMPEWQKQKGPRNGYVMLTTLLSGTLRPTILVLDVEDKPSGRLSYRQLHQ